MRDHSDQEIREELIRQKNKRARESGDEWSYSVECLHPGCGWKESWQDAATWKKGCARVHADQNGHRVRTVSTKVIVPKEAAPTIPDKEPTEKDRDTAYCEQCKRYIGVGAGKFFQAATKAHYKKTRHTIRYSPNPKYHPAS